VFEAEVQPEALKLARSFAVITPEAGACSRRSIGSRQSASRTRETSIPPDALFRSDMLRQPGRYERLDRLKNAESPYRKTNALGCQFPSYIFADQVGTSWSFAMELAIGRVRARR
jgi:hypothetical protein